MTQDQQLTQRGQAVQRKDLAALEHILGPDFTFPTSGQGRWSRQQWLDAVRICDIHDFTFRESDVRPYVEVIVRINL